MLRLFVPALRSHWVLVHCGIALLIVLVPGQIIFGEPIWSLPRAELVFLSGISLAYLVAVVFMLLRADSEGRVRFRDFAVSIAVAFGGYFLYLLATDASYQRIYLLAAFIISFCAILLSCRLNISIQRLIVITALIVGAGLQALGERPKEVLLRIAGRAEQPQKTATALIDTAYYAVRTRFYDRYFDNCDDKKERCQKPRNGGGIALVRGGYLAVTGEGNLFFASQSEGNDSLDVVKLPYLVPINSRSFASSGHGGDLWKFRVADILILENGEKIQLIASHHYWKSTEQCFVFRVSSLESDYQRFLAGESRSSWRTVYETQPCLPLVDGQRFYGDESGGRLVSLTDEEVILTVGDFSRDGLMGGANLAQDKNGEYGKTILINLKNGSGEIYTTGHRNPQGLFLAPTGELWSTEHGPRGGDELNLLIRNRNYGWPVVTLGTAALVHRWPLNPNTGKHDGYEPPIYAWLPDIGISNLIKIKGTRFQLWEDDLMIASYKKRLMRLRIRNGRVNYVEAIEIRGHNARIRDILEDDDGRIMLWIDGGSVAFLESFVEDEPIQEGPGNEDIRGELLFAGCRACHNVNNGRSHAIGPDLFGVVHRKIAHAPGYSYSDALSNKTGIWSEENLDDFLEDPETFAPGTSMRFSGIPEGDDRAKLISYLKSLK